VTIGAVAPAAPYLEREPELARIEQCLAAAADGNGTVLLIEGPAGIGKTSLLAATRATGAARGMRVLRARGAELEREFAFGVVRQLFEPTLARLTAEERGGLLAGPAGIAGRMLGLPGAGPADDTRGGAPDRSFAVLHGLYWLCAGLAAERPVCLIVDDAHWADTPSLRYLAFLLPRLEELRVALVVAARPGEAATAAELLAALAADASAKLMTPTPLTAAGVGRLLSERLGRPPDLGFVDACHHATGGNPFLVHQLGLALREDAVAPSAHAAARVEDLGARWASRWILLRLGRLPQPATRLARALAILERGELAIAAALARIEHGEAVAAADALVAADIIAPGRPLAFVHPIVRAGIYGDIGSAERARGHREAARLLAEAHAPEELAVEHLLASEPAGDGWVVEQLTRAARAAGRSGAPELAASHLRRALAEPPSPALRASLLLELGIAEDNAGEAGAHRHMDEAMAATQDAEARVATAVVLGHSLARHNRFADALDVLDRAVASPEARDAPSAASAEALAASIATFTAATARRHAGRIRAARELVETAASPTHEQLALAAQLAVRANEPADVAAGLALRALEATRGAAPGPTGPPWFHQCAVTLLWSERNKQLAALLEETVDRARASGDAGLFSGALAYRSWLAMRRGDPRAAEADARTALEAEHLPAPAMYRLRSASVLVEALVEQDELEQAERLLGAIETEAADDSTLAANLRVSRGRLRLARRQARDALADFVGAGDIARRTELLCPGCLPWRSAAALAQLALGRDDEARALADEELRLARAFGAPRALGVALHAAGLAAGGAAGERLLHEAVATLERADARLELARATAELGALLRRAKRRAEARTLLSRALDAAHRAGARALASRTETELRATGAKPRRTVLSGIEALTASERRVAELAAEGLTNREIAQALFVTARTVEGHLTHVFRKLALRSREQLAPLLAGEHGGG